MDKNVAVIGAGHAGCEAALAAARMGCNTYLFAISLDSIAMMPCNPCIGGSAKGQLVREIDALGGQMGKIIDKSYIQSRMLNEGKGPAVYSLRAQADKQKYTFYMKQALEGEGSLYLRQSEIVEIIVTDGAVSGVRSESGAIYPCQSVIVSAGTYLKARCLYGETVMYTGPGGLRASVGLSDNLESLGFNLMRFKTGTPARVRKRSLDFSKMAIQPGSDSVVPFSFETDPEVIARSQIPCYLTYTNNHTHEVIRSGLHRSPMYSGVIEGTGTRYCPSIEDKIVRFADKDRHPVFIEPEGEGTDEMYVQGLSTSLPEDIQIAAYRTVPGLENCEFTRNGYAIEYDCIDATGLKPSLEAKNIKGLFFAGQICGSSGYEEAAAQGLVAGINAANYLNGDKALVLGRSDGYIGVLINDLVIKGTREPYRMMTSRAEFRLLLRQDNADLRLTDKGYAAGLISCERYALFKQKEHMVENEIKRLGSTITPPSGEVNNLLSKYGSSPISSGVKLSDLIKRPELSYDIIGEIDPSRPGVPEGLPEYVYRAVCEQVNIQIKYEGYINMQIAQAEASKKLELKLLPAGLDYNSISGLRIEAKQKLSAMQPENIGAASRITGVSPADIQVLLIYMKANNM